MSANKDWKYRMMDPAFAATQGGVGGQAASGGGSYAGLAASAEQERQRLLQREQARQDEVRAGYAQQIAKSSAAGQQAYSTLESNYAPIVADALATRERNMGRIDQYGASARQDLDIQNRQRLAAASQSAIQRGLGNTTIMDSLRRGQNFDNTRQTLALEDQLLQNRISTDSNLSGVYQGAMQNRAQALGQQYNTNISNDNQLADRRLGYIGGIQEDMNGFNSVANLYSQGLQMDNANRQAQLERSYRGTPYYGASFNSPTIGQYRRGG